MCERNCHELSTAEMGTTTLQKQLIRVGINKLNIKLIRLVGISISLLEQFVDGLLTAGHAA